MLMSPHGRLAQLQYLPNGFRMRRSGDHVLCALSGAVISLEQLRYWSVDRQEAYASCALAVEAICGRKSAV